MIMRRNINPTPIAYNLPFIFLPVLYVGFLMANILFWHLLSFRYGHVFFGALGLRLFGYYEVSRKGKANLLSIGITVLALFLLFLTAPEPTGVSKLVDAFLPTNYYHFQGILNMF